MRPLGPWGQPISTPLMRTLLLHDNDNYLLGSEIGVVMRSEPDEAALIEVIDLLLPVDFKFDGAAANDNMPAASW